MTDPIHTEPRDSHGRFAPDAQAGTPLTAVARVKDTAEAAREAAAEAARRTAESMEANPLGIVVGGLALGALLGALVPRSAREKELLAPVGKTLGERARAAIGAAKDTARTELSENGLTKNAAQAQVRGLVESLTRVAQNVGAAAVKSAADRR